MSLHTGLFHRQDAVRLRHGGLPAAQRFQCGLICVRALALEIGGVGLVCARALVPCKAQPAQIVHKLACVLRTAAGGVQIFDAKNKTSAAAFYRQPCQKRCQRIAQMHAPGGAGRKTPHRGRGQCPPAPFTSMEARRSTEAACSAGTAESGTGFAGACGRAERAR